jgi:peptidoglycan/xylan/chitin deacetylase (PgdA/CDA1 family)
MDPFLPGAVTKEEFTAQMGVLSKIFNVIPLEEAIDRINKNSLEPRSACVTFDDGYVDNVTNALPILRKYNIAATFFITTGFLEKKIMWNDIVIETFRNVKKEYIDLSPAGLMNFDCRSIDAKKNSIKAFISQTKYLSTEKREDIIQLLIDNSEVALSNELMMNEEQIRQLKNANMGIGGHTVNHPILACESNEVAFSEIMEGKERLESIIGETINVFAYPNGKPGDDYTDEHVRMVKKVGFNSAVSTVWGVAKNSSDRFQLPRFSPWDKNKNKFIFRLYQNCIKN